MVKLTLPKLLLWIVGSAILALYAHALFYSPIPYGDQFTEIYRTLTLPPAENFSVFLAAPSSVFRPGEIAMRYFIIYTMGRNPSSYIYFQVLFLLLVGATAISFLKCRSWADTGPGITSITFLFGHHAFPSVFEANNSFSTGLVLLLMMIAIYILE